MTGNGIARPRSAVQLLSRVGRRKATLKECEHVSTISTIGIASALTSAPEGKAQGLHTRPIDASGSRSRPTATTWVDAGMFMRLALFLGGGPHGWQDDRLVLQCGLDG